VEKRAETGESAGAAGAGSNQNPLFRAPASASAAFKERQRILEAMLEIVGSVGYREASVPATLARAGVDRGVFEDNFADKEECYLAAFREGLESLEARLAEAAVGQRSWRGALRFALDALLAWLEAQPALGRALLVEVHAAGEQARKGWEEALKRVAGFIDLAQDEATGPGSAVRISPERVVGGLYAVVYSRLGIGSATDIRTLLPDLVYFAVLPYFGPELASEEMQKAREKLQDRCAVRARSGAPALVWLAE
jgi:AcrR family transcriptional regulator